MTASHYDVKQAQLIWQLKRLLASWISGTEGARVLQQCCTARPWTWAPARWPSTPPTPACLYSITSCIGSTALQTPFGISYLRQHRQAEALMYQLATTAAWTTKHNRACRTALQGHSRTSTGKGSLGVKEDRFMLQSQETCCKHRKKKRFWTNRVSSITKLISALIYVNQGCLLQTRDSARIWTKIEVLLLSLCPEKFTWCTFPRLSSGKWFSVLTHHCQHSINILSFSIH